MSTQPASIGIKTPLGNITVTVEMDGNNASQDMVNATARAIKRHLAQAVPNVSEMPPLSAPLSPTQLLGQLREFYPTGYLTIQRICEFIVSRGIIRDVPSEPQHVYIVQQQNRDEYTSGILDVYATEEAANQRVKSEEATENNRFYEYFTEGHKVLRDGDAPTV
jgi:hypothetical protein